MIPTWTVPRPITRALSPPALGITWGTVRTKAPAKRFRRMINHEYISPTLRCAVAMLDAVKDADRARRGRAVASRVEAPAARSPSCRDKRGRLSSCAASGVRKAVGVSLDDEDGCEMKLPVFKPKEMRPMRARRAPPAMVRLLTHRVKLWFAER